MSALPSAAMSPYKQYSNDLGPASLVSLPPLHYGQQAGISSQVAGSQMQVTQTVECYFSPQLLVRR